MKATVKWVDGQQFVGINDRNFTVVMDSLPEFGGEGVGMQPIELFLIALAGCTAHDITGIMLKKRQVLTSFSIEIEGTRFEDYPKAFKDIHLIYKVHGKDIDERALQRAIELSEEKYCSVRATVLGIPEVANVTHSYEISEA